MRHSLFCLFLSLLVLFAGTARAAVIVNGVEKGDSYTVSDSTDAAAVFTGTGTIIQTGSAVNPAKYTGSFTGFSGVLRLTRTTGEFWLLSGPNLVKGEGKDLEMNVAASNASLVFNDPDEANPITYRFSVLNGTGTVRTSNGTKVQTCTLVLGTDTANYAPQYGNDFSGNIRDWDISGSRKSHFNLIKVGTNTQILSGNNSSGLVNVEIQGGVLEAASATALGAKNVKLNGGTLRLDQAIGGINYAAASGDYTPNGTIEVNAAAGESWDLEKYQTGSMINFVKTGEGTVRMTGNYSGGALNSAEIREGRIQIYGDTAEQARVFPAYTNVQIHEGASVEYLKNSQDFNNICPYSIYGGELISNIEGSHLTAGHLGLYGGTLTGVGDGSNYGNFLFDGNLTAYQSDINGGVSNINASKVDFSFRNGRATKAIQVKPGAQLNLNAVITSAFTDGVSHITKLGGGLLVFTKANVYNLPTNVNEGTLRLSEAGTLGNASKTVTVARGATLEIANGTTVANPLTISGTGVSNAGAVNFTSDATLSGAVTLGANASINVADGKIGKLTGSVSGSSFDLTKTGAGTLKIDASQSLFDVKDLIVSAGQVDFIGNTTGGITVQDAIFSPGNSPGAATVGGAFTLSSGNSILLMEVAGTEPDQNDSLVVTGDLNLNDGLIYLELADTYSLTNGDRVTAILSRAVGTGYTPESDFIEKYVRSTIFTDLAYELLPSGLYAITATYDRNAVPEPSAWLLLALGFGGLMIWKKRMTK